MSVLPFRCRVVRLGTVGGWVTLGTLVLVLQACGDQTVEVADTQDSGGEGASETPIVVVVDEREVDVLLSTLEILAENDEVPQVRLSDILSAAQPASGLAAYHCDFVADDGFRTSAMGVGCEPIACDVTADATVAVDTRDVAYDPELNMRGCYQPQNLARVEMDGGL